MLKYKVLFYDTEKANRKNAQRTLAAIGANVFVPKDFDEASQMLAQNSFALLIFDISLHRYLTEKKFDLEDNNIVLLANEKLHSTREYLDQLNLITHFVAKNSEGEISPLELQVTTKKILTNDVFGPEKYLSWGASKMVFHFRKSLERQEYIDFAEDYCRQMRLRTPVINAVKAISDEFLMNAFYDAPIDSYGNELYKAIPRSVPVVLPPRESARYEIACDGELLAVSVTDPYGTLNKQTLLEYLSRCFFDSGSKMGPKEKAGGGVGIYICYNSVSKLIINVDPRIRTEFIGIIDLNLSVREFKSHSKSFHFFVKNRNMMES